MADKTDKAVQVSNYLRGRALVPFTGGLIIFVYAWFWPDGYGRWLGTMVKAFRDTTGF